MRAICGRKPPCFFASVSEPQVCFVSINIVFGYRGKELKWKSTTGLLQRRVRCGDRWSLCPRDEFTYWLGRNSLRGILEDHREKRLKELAGELGREDAENCANLVYAEKRKQEIVRACADGTIRQLIEGARRQLKREAFRQHPASESVYAVKDGWRLVKRWWKPSGLFLALLGPDGVGKSTTTARIKQDLTSLFSQQREFHWRPQLIMPRPEEPETNVSGLQEMFSQNRHGDPPRGFLISIARLLGVMLDYWIGYVAQIRKQLARSGLIVFDRYYHDIFVDSLRYRYGGPRWLLRALRVCAATVAGIFHHSRRGRAGCLFPKAGADIERDPIPASGISRSQPQAALCAAPSYRSRPRGVQGSSFARNRRAFGESLPEFLWILDTAGVCPSKEELKCL